MRCHRILKLFDRALVEDEVELAYMLENYLAVKVFYRYPFKLVVDPLEIVVEGLDIFKTDYVIRLRLLEGFFKLALPSVLGYHIDKLLNHGMKLGCCHVVVLIRLLVKKVIYFGYEFLL